MRNAIEPSNDAGGAAQLRRHATGADTARGLLLTVMGELLLPSGGLAWTATFLDVLGRLGLEPGTTRQALARTASAGWLNPERVGRRTRWRLTASGEQLLVEGAKRIYEFDGPQRDWDGRCLVVLVSVPDSERAMRHLVRTRLSWAGLGNPAPGVWFSTHPDRLAEVEEALERAGAFDTAQVFIGEHVGNTRLGQMVEAAWDLAVIDDEYREFLAEFASTRAPDPLAGVLELVHAWRRFPWRDPSLPRELLPATWSGSRAATLFRDRHDRWSPAAVEEWNRVTGDPR